MDSPHTTSTQSRVACFVSVTKHGLAMGLSPAAGYSRYAVPPHTRRRSRASWFTRPQAHSQSQPDNRVARLLPRFITNTPIRLLQLQCRALMSVRDGHEHLRKNPQDSVICRHLPCPTPSTIRLRARESRRAKVIPARPTLTSVTSDATLLRVCLAARTRVVDYASRVAAAPEAWKAWCSSNQLT